MRNAGGTVLGPNSPFRLQYLERYAGAARPWLHAEAEVVDTTHLTPAQAALRTVPHDDVLTHLAGGSPTARATRRNSIA